MADDPFDIFDEEPAPASPGKPTTNPEAKSYVPEKAADPKHAPTRTFADFQREKREREAPKPDPAMDRAQTYPDRFGVAGRGARPEAIGTPIASVRGTPEQPCGREFSPGGHRCRVGGGDACYSDDFGKTWFCSLHRPSGFLPQDR